MKSCTTFYNLSSTVGTFFFMFSGSLRRFKISLRACRCKEWKGGVRAPYNLYLLNSSCLSRGVRSGRRFVVFVGSDVIAVSKAYCGSLVTILNKLSKLPPEALAPYGKKRNLLRVSAHQSARQRSSSQVLWPRAGQWRHRPPRDVRAHPADLYRAQERRIRSAGSLGRRHYRRLAWW